MNVLAENELSKREIKALRIGLRQVKAGVLVSTTHGVCYNLQARPGCCAAYEVVCAAASVWPKRVAGNADDTGWAPYPIARVSKSRWVGEELALRHDLIDFVDGLLAELEAL